MATYYVDPVSGSDANAGTSFGAAWATTQKAADTAIAGDEVRLCATGTETPSSVTAFDTNSGTYSNHIRFVAYNATGTAPLTTGYYTISGASLGAGADIFDMNGQDRIDFDGIRLTGAPAHGMEHSSGTLDGVYLRRCRIDNCGGNGIYMDNSSQFCSIVDCEIDDNVGDGVGQSTSSRGRLTAIASSIHDNGEHGINLGQVCTFVGCQVFDNTLDGIHIHGASAEILVTGCTIYGNGSDGIHIDDPLKSINVSNSSIAQNGGYGISTNSNGLEFITSDRNHTHNNTSGIIDTGTLPGSNNVTGDPLFASVVDGSEDFTPGASSPLAGAGVNGTTIGALPAAAGSGGGGGGGILRGVILQG